MTGLTPYPLIFSNAARLSVNVLSSALPGPPAKGSTTMYATSDLALIIVYAAAAFLVLSGGALALVSAIVAVCEVRTDRAAPAYGTLWGCLACGSIGTAAVVIGVAVALAIHR